MQVFCNTKRIWKKAKPKCNHKLEMLFALDTPVTGTIILEGCRCTSTVRFN